MTLDDKPTPIVPDNNTLQSHPHEDDALLQAVAEIRLLHKATLQDLLCTKNYAIQHL